MNFRPVEDEVNERLERAAIWLYRDETGWLERDNWYGIHEEARRIYRRRANAVAAIATAPEVPE